MGKTSIEWTKGEDGSDGMTWNPVRGCTKISAGCKNCYAERFAERWRGIPGHAFEQGFDLRLVPEKLEEPLRWKKPCRIFVNSMSDLFHKDVPDAYLLKVFQVMTRARWHTYLILTKRSDRMLNFARCFRYDPASGEAWLGKPDGYTAMPALKHVWLGVSVENRASLSRMADLLQTPAAVRFVSFEPLLEDLGDVNLSGLDLAIVGGESGPGARPFNLRWAVNVVNICRREGVAPFVKQMGADPYVSTMAGPDIDLPVPIEWSGHGMATVRPRFKDRKGGDMAEWPECLRVREMPGSK
jgi:protein gp37